MQFTVQLIYILFEHCALCDHSVSVVVRTSCGWSFTEVTQLPVGGASQKLHNFLWVELHWSYTAWNTSYAGTLHEPDICI